MLGLSNAYFYTIIAIVVLSIVYLGLQSKYPQLTENFSEKHHHGHHHKHHENKHHEHGAKHGHHPISGEHHAALHEALAEVKSQKSQEAPTPQPQMHLINKRELILRDRLTVVNSNPADILANNLAYGPFSYGALDSINPLPNNSKMLYRLYGIYSDTMTTDGVVQVQFNFGWSGNRGSFAVDLPRTWGGIGNQRDGYSKFFTFDDMKNAGVIDPHEHAIVTANSTVGGTQVGFYKLYIETWLLY
jgi:hypothetical protein